MPNIYCTKKLEKIVGKVEPFDREEKSSFGNWNANVFYVDRKKRIFVINYKTCYSIIIPDFLKRDLKNFKQIFYERLFQQMKFDGIVVSSDLQSQLLQRPLTFMKTNNNRRIIGTMTQFIKDLQYFLFYYDEILTLNQLNSKVTDNLVNGGSEDNFSFESPIVLMKQLVAER